MVFLSVIFLSRPFEGINSAMSTVYLDVACNEIFIDSQDVNVPWIRIKLAEMWGASVACDCPDS